MRLEISTNALSKLSKGNQMINVPFMWILRFRRFCLSSLRIALFVSWPVLSWGMVDVALYDDSMYTYGGAWTTGLDSIKTMLESYGYSYVTVTPDNVNQTDLASTARVIFFGGGWAGGYITYLNSNGYENIRQFIRQGGGYIGICAGAYLACDKIFWKPDTVTLGQWYDYALNLFTGTGVGVVPGIMDWTEPTGCSAPINKGAAMTTVLIDQQFFNASSETLPILYYGGPILTPYAISQNSVQILGKYVVPGSPADGSTAMVMASYGKGNMFLSGPHPEISFDNLTCRLFPNTQGWDLLHQVLQYLAPRTITDLKANGQDGPITVSTGTPVSITVSLSPGSEIENNADWWIVEITPWGVYSLTSSGWSPGINLLFQYPLFTLPPVDIYNGLLTAGDYTFYFGVDMTPDSTLGLPLYYDFVQIRVTK
jgi:glutamine amidotransferase-like uncharacterized protein